MCTCVVMLYSVCVCALVHSCICRSQGLSPVVVLQELSALIFETGSLPGLVELSDGARVAGQ